MHQLCLQAPLRSQAEVNAFLTQKMEEDKAAASASTHGDEKGEENYGEEVADRVANQSTRLQY
ncbi:uncharacterized protein K441DRAFT_606733 [Cenococcum geophilum 1.58]|uniref:uncharacterized protein n=1 Tax=Cenococcum geophilum 1.58 TaxID=794803 RepID=UPI00358E482B|nr:hypothetical protein K441DRAFT_606733 [Cenococcum geophilum 1.58]